MYRGHFICPWKSTRPRLPVFRVLNVVVPKFGLETLSWEQLLSSNCRRHAKMCLGSDMFQRASSHPIHTFRHTRKISGRIISLSFNRCLISSLWGREYGATQVSCYCLSSTFNPFFMIKVQISLAFLTCRTSSLVSMSCTKMYNASTEGRGNCLALLLRELVDEGTESASDVQTHPKRCRLFQICPAWTTKRFWHKIQARF